jgi:hypothetical protein
MLIRGAVFKEEMLEMQHCCGKQGSVNIGHVVKFRASPLRRSFSWQIETGAGEDSRQCG